MYIGTFIRMITEFSAMCDGLLGRISVAIHGIALMKDGSKLVHLAIRHAGLKMMKFEKVEIEKMFARKVTEPTQSEWSATIVFAPEKDSTLCFCINHGWSIVLSKRQSYPISGTDKCIDSIGKAVVFSTFHANSGYW